MIDDATFLVLGILFVHWVGDFVLQTHWMATNKSRNRDALLSHISVYYLTLVLGTGLLFYHSYGADSSLWGMLVMWWIINGAAHFAVDFVTSRLTSRLWQREDYHNFFVVVGFDQFLHYACLFATLHWMLGLPPR